jgi:hypothetical protein
MNKGKFFEAAGHLDNQMDTLCRKIKLGLRQAEDLFCRVQEPLV